MALRKSSKAWDTFRTRFGHVSDTFRTRFGHVNTTGSFLKSDTEIREPDHVWQLVVAGNGEGVAQQCNQRLQRKGNNGHCLVHEKQGEIKGFTVVMAERLETVNSLVLSGIL